MMIGGSALRATADIAFASGNFTIVGTDLPMPATPECIRRAIREQMPS